MQLTRFRDMLARGKGLVEARSMLASSCSISARYSSKVIYRIQLGFEARLPVRAGTQPSGQHFISPQPWNSGARASTYAT